MGAPVTHTIYTICNGDAKAIDALRKRISRSSDPRLAGFRFDRKADLTDGVLSAINDMQKDGRTDNVRKGRTKGVKRTRPDVDTNTDNAPDNTPDIKKHEASIDLPAANERWAGFAKNWPQLAIMALIAVASFGNMIEVFKGMTGEAITAYCLAIAYMVSPFVFIYKGMAGSDVKTLVYTLIAVEVFCNSMRIYGGLTGFGGSGNPTRFLGLICEFFGAGTYGTATIVSVVFSSVAAWLMYTAFNSVKK
jgi:hypothetical protein